MPSVTVWNGKEEYSHAWLIPLISLFLVCQRRNELAAMRFTGSWAGVGVVVLGILLGLVGQMATVYTVQQIGLVVAICGFVLALTGWSALRLLWMPLLLQFFMIPQPQFLQSNLSAGMQLWSSALGVWFIRLMGIGVYLEGNVIDLGTYQLQVVEACDGLRYLFPLMSFGFLIAVLYQGPRCHRWVIFLSTFPITVFMNSLRIGIVGITVDRWGIEAA